eukprot:14018243-Alexandrium_andersonii.AAC.1
MSIQAENDELHVLAHLHHSRHEPAQGLDRPGPQLERPRSKPRPQQECNPCRCRSRPLARKCQLLVHPPASDSAPPLRVLGLLLHDLRLLQREHEAPTILDPILATAPA